MASPSASRNLSTQEKKSCCSRRRFLIAFIVGAVCITVAGLVVCYLTPYGLKQADEELFDESKSSLHFRLPRSIVPEHYDLELQPYIIENNFTFDGKVRIVIRVLEPTDNVTLHINDITVDATSVKVIDAQSGTEEEIVSQTQHEDQNFYILHLKRNLTEGSVYEIYIGYVGNITDYLIGFYRSSYTDADGNKRWLALSKFEPTYARWALPCFDEPALKATFNVTIVRFRNMTSLSNMPKYKSEDRDDGWVADYFEKTVRMSTYLLAFVISDFKSLGTPEFSVWSREEALNATQYALDIGPKILNYFASYFNVPYALPKTDMIAIPNFRSGAMENWGLITYRETTMLYDSRISSAETKQKVASVIAHEMAHEWFGNLVTMVWWDNLWLNEGFATYMKYIGVNAVHPDWKMDDQFVLHETQNLMDRDAFEGYQMEPPVYRSVKNSRAIFMMFNRISYGKGACIIRMMKYFLGERNFKAGLTNYLKAKKYGNANQDELWEHLTAVQNKNYRIDVKTVMDSWTLNSGYPLVEVIRNYTAGTAEVKQHRFLLYGGKGHSNKAENYQWEIPLTYTDGLHPIWRPVTRLWLHKTNGTIKGLPSSEHWIVANVKQVGFYRVAYDEHNRRLLAEQLLRDHTKIHTTNRAQIIDDALDLAEAGRLSYSLALNTTLYLKNEEEYIPWKPAFDRFSSIDRNIRRTPVYGMWKNFITNQLKSRYESLGWEESTGESVLTQYMRVKTLEWMCAFDYKDCVEKAQAKFEEWKQDSSNVEIIQPELQNLVFCTAVKHGGQEAWNFLFEKHKTAKEDAKTVLSFYDFPKIDPRDKYLTALACAREPWLLRRFLHWSFKNDSGLHDFRFRNVFSQFGSNLYGRDLIFNVIKENWDTIFKRDGFNLLTDVTSTFNTRFELSQLKDLYDSHKDELVTFKHSIASSIENIERRIKWMDNNYEQIADWLKMTTNIYK